MTIAVDWDVKQQTKQKTKTIYRSSMTAHILLNLSIKSSKGDKMPAFGAILCYPKEDQKDIFENLRNIRRIVLFFTFLFFPIIIIIIIIIIISVYSME